MYIRPLIFDRDVVGSKQIRESYVCVLHVYDRKASVFIAKKKKSQISKFTTLHP